MSKKKLILIPALLLALTSCGPTSSAPTDPTTDLTTSEPTTDPTDPTTNPTDPTTGPVEAVVTAVEITNKDVLTAEWSVGNVDRTISYRITYSDGTTKARGANVTSSDTNIVNVIGSKLVAVSAGKATITVEIDGVSDSVELTVQPKEVIVAPKISEILAGNKGDKTNARGELLQISYGGYFIGDDSGIIFVHNASDPTWKIGDTIAIANATIDEYGYIKQLKSPEIQEAEANDSVNITIDFVEKTGAELTALTSDQKKVIIPVKITATKAFTLDDYKHFWVMPGFDDKTILYSGYLNDEDKANDLSEGVRYEMTGFIAGYGTHNEYSNRLNFYPVTMKKVESIEVESVSLEIDRDTIEIGKTATLTPKFSPEGAVGSVTYSITAGEDVIQVSDAGKITGIKAGTARVKAVCGTLESNEVEITVVEPATGPEITEITEPKAGVPYHLSFVQTNVDNTRFYFNGKENGNYLDTSNELAYAAGIVLETTEGGYHIYNCADGKYINAVTSGTYCNAKIQDTAVTVWKWNAEYNTLTTYVEGEGFNADFYMGTYKTFTTISMSNISYAATSITSSLITVNNPPIVTPVTEPEVGVSYAFGFVQTNLDNKEFYFTGKEDGNYLATSETPVENIVLEATEGGYFIKVGDKYINAVTSGKYCNAKIQDTAVTVWKWNAEYNTLTTYVEGEGFNADFYMGTYKTFTTISMSNISYAATSIVGHFYTVKNSPIEAIIDNEPVAGVAYKLGFVQKNIDNAIFYFNGNEDGNYLATSETDAADIVLETTEGGYFIKTGDKYINAVTSGKYCNAKIQDTAVTVWKWNAEYNTLTTYVEGEGFNADFYMGTYKTFTTISMSNISYAATSITSFLAKRYEEPSYTPKAAADFSALNMDFSAAANKADGDAFLNENYPTWKKEGKLGQTYGGYLGFGRSGDTKSAIISPEFDFNSNFKITALIKGYGNNGVVTSTLTFTLVDAEGNVVATGYANESTDAAITPIDGKDTTYEITFTFVEGKSIADASNLRIAFAKETGNIGLKSLTAVAA